MRHAGPTFVPAVITLGVAAAVLFVADATWLRLTSALFLLLGIALAVVAIATPEFLAADADADVEDRG